MSKPPKKQTPRITAAEMEARVNKVYELLLNGATRYQILQYAASRKAGWGVTPRQVDSYIKSANALIAAEAEFHRQREFGRALAGLNDLYQKCMKGGHYRVALAVRREINALLSLYEPPAERTLRVLGISESVLADLVSSLSSKGMKASDVFNALLEELADAEEIRSEDERE